MSAIRNIGELASPYFLLEVWARREEIDIDPETYASLKRRARALVRDARGFELRGEEPDDDWRQRRLEMLALEPLDERGMKLDDGTETLLGVWCESTGADAAVVGDLPGFADPDRRGEDQADPTSTRFELALDAYDGDADWGVLLAGLQVRIYRRSSGISQQYLALDLDTLVELDDEPAWKAFAAMFRAPAFAAGADGVPLIRRVVDESRRHASALAADMRRDVVDAAEAIIQGALDHPENAAVIGEPTRSTLHDLFEESLYVLYRVLFVLYAESRDVLPVSGLGPYATSYSVDHLVELARRGGARPDGRYFHDALSSLFALLWDGPSAATQRLGFEPVGGELFDPERTPLLGRCTIPDIAWERALNSIALGAPDSPRRRLGRRSSFAELGVDQLGSIYEGLLVLEPYLAAEPAYLGAYKGERRVFDDADIDGFNVLRHLSQGDFVLESAGGRRKGTGSFYTPHEITEYLSRAAVDPLLEPILELAADDPETAAEQLLDLKVCDPAMGSGAFLVQAARVLALSLARIRASRGDGLVTPDRVHHAKREVVRHCLYGVDLNPLAVVLAKVSLWLETLEPGRPLSFLDAHLRCGDSLVGVDFVTDAGEFTAVELATFPANAHKGLETYLKNEAGERGEPVLARLKHRKAPKAAHQATLPGIDRSAIEAALEQLAEERERIAELEEGADTLFDTLHAKEAFEALEAADNSIRNRLRRAADFWCAQWFSDGEGAISDASGPVVPASVADFEQIVATLVAGEQVSERLRPELAAADAVSERRKFFHWALEFPEVFLERGGFDAVMGNPPWNEVTPTPREFFATYDPVTFRRGVAKKVQDERQAALRQADPEIDSAWRAEARWLQELSAYSKLEAGRFVWVAPDGQLRKGDANVFRLFVERAYSLLRSGGHLGQVLPESVYQASQTTGVRQHLLSDGQLRSCWVFENRKLIFPIHRSVKVVLLLATRSGGPTEAFRAAFLTGRNPAGRDRAVGLEELATVLATLDDDAATMTVEQVRALSPVTWSFPELQTALDAEVAAQCVAAVPGLQDGWKLRFCTELHGTNDAWRFRSETDLEAFGAKREGLRWIGPNGFEWWPVVGGTHFYHLEFPAEGKSPSFWVDSAEFREIDARTNPDGTSVADHYRVTWRRIGSPTNERSAIAAVIPPRTVAINSAPTVWGGVLDDEHTVALAAVMSSFCFDYLFRARGTTNLTHSAVGPVPAPSWEQIKHIVPVAAEVTSLSSDFFALWSEIAPSRMLPALDAWSIAERRAVLDAEVAVAYGLSAPQFCAVLSTFPNVDRSQPMLPGEAKCFVTRDIALKAFCDLTGSESLDVAKLLREIGAGLPDPDPGYRDLSVRIGAYRDLGAVPYRPTPRGGRVPTDPSLVEDVVATLSDDAQSGEDIAEALGEDSELVTKILKDLRKTGDVYVEGRGKNARYYVVGED
ncbi:MAG TPA: N-6 DNA methylase [Acidimicrobiales bacterium]|nr:N-6 DNA methylase [Acidimicrobiales bacterium]